MSARRVAGIALAGAVVAAVVLPARASAGAAPGTTRSQGASTTYPLQITTVPRLAGVRFQLGSTTFSAGRNGVARILAGPGSYRLRVVDQAIDGRHVRSRFSRWGDNSFTPARTVDIHGPTRLEVGFEQSVRVSFAFVDLQGRPVPEQRVTRVTLSSTIGSRESFTPRSARWLLAGRVTRRFTGLDQTKIQYSVERAVVEGADVVNRAQQRFVPSEKTHIRLRLLLFSARLSAHDLLFGFRVGSRLDLVYPDGHRTSYTLKGSPVDLGALPRGTYGIAIHALGYSPAVPLALSKNQALDLRVVSYLDVVVLLLVGLILTIVLIVARRPHLRLRLVELVRPHRRRDAALAAVGVVGLLLGVLALAHATGRPSPVAYAKVLGTLGATGAVAFAVGLARRPWLPVFRNLPFPAVFARLFAARLRVVPKKEGAG